MSRKFSGERKGRVFSRNCTRSAGYLRRVQYYTSKMRKGYGVTVHSIHCCGKI
jgi:hypothetical protein